MRVVSHAPLASLILAAAALAGACEDATPSDDWADCSSGRCDEATAVPAVHAPGLLVNDLAVLGDLERANFDLGSHFLGDGRSAASLTETSALYRQLTAVVASDIAEMQADDSASGVGIDFFHRLFDVKWLTTNAARFRLVAITNRVDLAYATPGACGEVRFVYRLMYTSDAGPSRLPMTLMVVREQGVGQDDCRSVAQTWLSQRGSAQELLGEPLADLGPISRVELNLQAVRWPSGARTNMGGHAEYLLRILKVEGETLSVDRLPNTIAGDLSEEKAGELRSWIVDHLPEIDDGRARVPEEFLATRAFSVSARGLARRANRPFLKVFPNPELSFADVDFSGFERVQSPGGLLRRLDTMSCQGCHQSRGLAGFHVLGEDDADTPRGNAITVGTSPHLNDELRWRQRHMTSIADGGPIDQLRPLAERDPDVPGIYGAHCGLGDRSFASWDCAAGFVCADLNGEEVGTCVSADGPGAGDSCETSSVTVSDDPHRDRLVDMQVLSCDIPGTASASCSRTSQGFPNGACTSSCSTKGLASGDAICGSRPPAGFNECILTGHPFTECLENSGRALRRRCDAVTPCGDDYVCSGVPGAPEGVGACMPPYFIFQARVDGHNVPS